MTRENRPNILGYLNWQGISGKYHKSLGKKEKNGLLQIETSFIREHNLLIEETTTK